MESPPLVCSAWQKSKKWLTNRKKYETIKIVIFFGGMYTVANDEPILLHLLRDVLWLNVNLPDAGGDDLHFGIGFTVCKTLWHTWNCQCNGGLFMWKKASAILLTLALLCLCIPAFAVLPQEGFIHNPYAAVDFASALQVKNRPALPHHRLRRHPVPPCVSKSFVENTGRNLSS